MPAAGAALGHQAGGLQGLLDEAVGQLHAVLAPGELMKGPDVEAGVPVAWPIALAVQPQHALDLGEGHGAGRGLSATAIEQPVIAHAL
jgi:hypothetical protein